MNSNKMVNMDITELNLELGDNRSSLHNFLHIFK